MFFHRVRTPPIRVREIVLAAAALTTLAGCGGSGSTTAVLAVSTVEIMPVEGALHTAGSTMAFSATARDRSGAAIPGVPFTWSSSDARVATIDAEGMATAVGPGATTIQATVPGATGSATLVVVQPGASVVAARAPGPSR